MGIALLGSNNEATRRCSDILFHISEKSYLTFLKKGTSFAPSIEQCILGVWEESIKERTLYIYLNPRPEKTIPPYSVWDSEITEERISTISIPAIKVGEVKIVNKKLLDDVKREYYSKRRHKYDKLDSFTVKEHWYQELYKHGTLFDVIWY